MVRIHTFGFNGGLQLPFGDLSDRFGGNGTAGFSYHYKTKTNWLIGAEGNLIFGSNVKNSDELASQIRTPDGFFIDNQGFLATVLIQERGLDVRLVAGKIFPLFGPNENSGLLVKFGEDFCSTGYVLRPGKMRSLKLREMNKRDMTV